MEMEREGKSNNHENEDVPRLEDPDVLIPNQVLRIRRIHLHKKKL